MDFEKLADQVLAIDSSKDRCDVILDLEYTKNAEETINRIFDGNFLEGVQRTNTSISNEALVILDSDDEDDGIDLPNISNEETSETTKNGTIFFDDDVLDVPNSPLGIPNSPVATTKQNYFSVDSLESLSPTLSRHNSIGSISKNNNERAFSLDSIESLSPSPRQTIRNEEEDDFSFLSREEKDPFGFTNESDNEKRKTPSESISLVDSDSEGSLPSMDDFFDKLMTQKGTRRQREPEDIPIDRKGKKRALSLSPSPVVSQVSDIGSSTSSYTTKEQKKLELQEKKRLQAEERNRIANEKKRLREEKLEERKREKELKAIEKERSQLREKENRLKNDRKEILKEMIVDLHPEFIKTTAGELIKSVLDRKEAITKSVEHKKHHISWRRIVKSEWDENTLTFIPHELPKIIEEPFILVYLDVIEFVKYIKQDRIDTYIDEIELTAKDKQIFLLVEGLETYYKKKLTFQRRLFDNQIRSNLTGSTITINPRKKTRDQEIENGPVREIVEECINYLQLIRNIMFVITKNDEDSASWIDSLTTDLALRRYKLKNVNNAIKSGKAGSNPTDNYSKMLQEIQLCTPAVAKSVIDSYPSLQSLHRAYESKDPSSGELLLANLEVERTVFHSRDRKVNRVMSKKIYTVFNATNPDQIIY